MLRLGGAGTISLGLRALYINRAHMGMSSFLRAAVGIMGRGAAPGLGMRLTVAGMRLRISGLGSRRSHYNECVARKRQNGSASRGAAKFRLQGHKNGLLAGGNWNNGTNCGSRSRNANNYRWNTNTNIGARLAADTGRKQNSTWLDLQPCFRRESPGAKHITERDGRQ